MDLFRKIVTVLFVDVSVAELSMIFLERRVAFFQYKLRFLAHQKSNGDASVAD